MNQVNTDLLDVVQSYLNRGDIKVIDGPFFEGRLTLGEAGVTDGVVLRLDVALGRGFVGEPADHVVVFRVDHHHGALAPRHLHHPQHLIVVELQALVGHVDLEGGIAVLDQGRQLLAQHLLARVRDDQVEGVVDHRLRPGERVIVGDRLAQGIAALLGGLIALSGTVAAPFVYTLF